MSRRGVDQRQFWGHVEKSAGGCWIWRGPSSKPTPSSAVYGKYGGRGVAHRVSYEMARGPIPAGLELDHLCLNTLCVNPAHLEPVTRLENMRRRMALVTHCPHGHELTADNVSPAGTKRCLRCKRERANRHYHEAIRPTRDVDRLVRECRNGHARTEENTLILKSGHRQCRACKRAKDAGYRRAKRDAIETRQLRAA